MSDTPVQEPALGLVDIQNAVKVIDFAAEQGAFKGWSTIEQVQIVRGKLQAFLDFAATQVETPVAEAAEAAEEIVEGAACGTEGCE